MYKHIDDLIRNVHNFSGVTSDSKKVKKNYIFVAVRGLTNDGHVFITEALKNGAGIVVGEKDPKPEYGPYIKVKDSRVALGTLASKWFDNPSQKLKVIGVTGTKGKTTTAYLIYHILSRLGKKTGLISSIKTKIGDKQLDTGLHVTSPDVVTLHGRLKEMVMTGCKYAVIEVSSHGIDQKRIAGIKFEIGILTNIAPEHLDYHKTFREYKRVKMSFINSCKYKITAPENTNLDILPGKFNNLNAEAALKTVKLLGFDRKRSLATLASFKLPEGRLEEIKNPFGFRVVIDFAHTPESLEAALHYLRGLTKGNLVAVFGAAGKRDSFKRPKMGRVASEIADKVILTAEDPRGENVHYIAGKILMGAKPKGASFRKISDRRKAILFALRHAKKGDTVGIFGKGHEKSMNIDGTHEIPWSDEKIVREYIKNIKK